MTAQDNGGEIDEAATNTIPISYCSVKTKEHPMHLRGFIMMVEV